MGFWLKLPSGVYVSENSTGNTISLSWEPIAGVSQYCVYYRQSSGPISQACTGNTNNYLTIGSNTPLSSDQVYYFSVSSLNYGVESSASNPEILVVPSVKPSPPNAVVLNATTAIISWVPITGSGMTYNVQRTQDFKNVTTISNVASPYNYVDLGIAPMAAYYYRIQPLQSGIPLATGS